LEIFINKIIYPLVVTIVFGGISMNKLWMIILAALAFTLLSSIEAEAAGCSGGFYQGGHYGYDRARYAYPIFSDCGRPARVGGYFGAGSAYIVGLRPGYYEPAPVNKCTPWGGNCGMRAARVGGFYGGGYYGYYGGSPSYGAAGYRSSYIYHGPI
jgi:hypothetical protein